MSQSTYRMSMSLSVLKQLGIKLYSSIPPVLSEAVANAWDADATEVNISIKNDQIVIEDNGHGMTVEDANNKYLLVGYERRLTDEGRLTPKFKRQVMGRKGIGKLSLFSIAKVVEVHTIKDGIRHGFRMDVDEIENQIKNSNGNVDYKPETIKNENLIVNKKSGTTIVLKSLRKKRFTRVEKSLKKRIARRFSILDGNNFTVKINGTTVTIQDRDYFDKIQYLWYFGKDGKKYYDYCKPEILKNYEAYTDELEVEWYDELEDTEKKSSFKISGWIGSVEISGNLNDTDDNLNKIVIMVRGKLAQEDILEDFSEGGLFTKYLIGEIHADFLDLDDWDETATANRQEIIKDEARYEALKEWLDALLKHIKNEWTDLRNKGGEKEALKIKAINEWFHSLQGDDKKYARSLFGKINQYPMDSELDKKELFTHSVLAFENLKYKRKLSLINEISIQNFETFARVMADYDDIEATMFHKLIKGRLGVIRKLQEAVTNNALERVVQELLYDHLWLLEPSWDRATDETPSMEENVQAEFDAVDASLTEEEARSRYDIKYKNPYGKHIIIELKRASRRLSKYRLLEQVEKYRDALRKCLKAAGKDSEPIEVVVLVGVPLKDWSDETKFEESRKMSAQINVRVLMYQELIENAYKAYRAFLEKNREVGRLSRLIEMIDAEYI